MENIIFVSRKFLPGIGGMQKQNYELYKSLSKYFNIKLISMGKKQINLIWFLPYAFFKSFLNSGRYDSIILGDGLLSPIGYFIKKLCNKKIYCVVHGLDVTYNNFFYQCFIPKYLDKLDKLICVSNNTIKECVKRGIKKEICYFIPNGINSEKSSLEYSKGDSRMLIEKKFNIDLKNKKILITIGRLKKRKGVYWFLTNVLDSLGENVIYLIIGSGDEEERIKSVLSNKSKLLKNVDERDKSHIYAIADIFIMPNIKVSGDVEGFGIVAIEAAINGVPVLTSNLEGIKDAIFDGKNGFLVETKDKNGFIKKINHILEMSPKKLELFKKNQIEFTKSKFNWGKIGEEYYKILKNERN